MPLHTLSRPIRQVLTVCLALTPLPVVAQTARPADGAASLSAAASDTVTRPRETTHQWLWGIGSANVLDTYLSPLEYTGPNLTLWHSTERLARWGRNRVTTYSLYALQGAYLHAPTDDGKEWDAELSAAGGWHYNWHPVPRLRLAAGGLLEATTGFTYNTRGSNNPAQGRLGVNVAASGLAEYTFPFLARRTATARLQLDAQLMGLQFSPAYGQSYYEIFSLGHSSGIIHFTHPGNCPTLRLSGGVTLPLWGARLTLGYLGDIRQSTLGGLKRHAWRHAFMIGYTRRLLLLRP